MLKMFRKGENVQVVSFSSFIIRLYAISRASHQSSRSHHATHCNISRLIQRTRCDDETQHPLSVSQGCARRWGEVEVERRNIFWGNDEDTNLFKLKQHQQHFYNPFCVVPFTWTKLRALVGGQSEISWAHLFPSCAISQYFIMCVNEKATRRRK